MPPIFYYGLALFLCFMYGMATTFEDIEQFKTDMKILQESHEEHEEKLKEIKRKTEILINKLLKND